MTMDTEELVTRLAAYARPAHPGGLRDYSEDLCDLAAGRISGLAAELIAARAKIEAAEKLADAVLAVKRICETQMRTADFHGADCRCWRCKEDAMFAALTAWDAAQ